VARQWTGGSSLELDADLWWQGFGGLTLRRTSLRLQTLLRVRDPPKFLFLHVGGNDLGRTKIKQLSKCADELFEFIKVNMPDTVVIWSEILPRDWGPGNKGLEEARKRINTYIVKIVKRTGGFYLRHINLMPFGSPMYDTDGVHLSLSGCKTLIANIRFGLLHFMKGEQPWFA